MTSQIIKVDEFDYVIFGGAGDLAERKLLPAIYYRDLDGQLRDTSRVIGVSRTARSDEDYRSFAHKALKRHIPAADIEPEAVKRFLARLHYRSVDALGEEGWDDLKTLLDAAEPPARVRAFYLAVGPEIFGAIGAKLAAKGLKNDLSRLVIEKPIGKDLQSARALNATIAEHFAEDQVFRIDHYLGKETVQNLMALRFANTLYEPVWNSSFIDHVQITVAESVGLENRAGYYDTSGALRDMVQNHLLQLLALVALEPPSSFTADAIRDEKLKVLRALAPIHAGNASQKTVRGQYRAGAVDGQAVVGYDQDLGSARSTTETFVALKAEINTWRWAGVPFYLRTGKRMPRRASEIVITFRPIPYSIFDENAGEIAQNRLVVRLQPGEGLKQLLMIKRPGPGGMRLRQVGLDMTFAEAFNIRHPDAYERLLMDVIRGDQALFMRRDEVEAAWDWVDPILAAWRDNEQRPAEYPSGTWGPTSAIALIERDGRNWHEPE
ncbi:glucose-6-phosphate dehydrogenase [Pelagibacterium lacus]|uniref:Glucose-6-phosphate 1-dehydrogenase n=1 Tax=Pelagibacterium lacus TaxID=2282655 RepID=A0A369W8T3_9HYPH|nr:glucose-6-phosphate dehydrogenase [Pelagibacterium lacus]RDE08471.1 glucose-6-phosphate dehydrogenase [Pelagibacterium lacus]